MQRGPAFSAAATSADSSAAPASGVPANARQAVELAVLPVRSDRAVGVVTVPSVVRTPRVMIVASILRVEGEAGSPVPGAGLRPGRVVRVGDSVRRAAGPWSSSVQGVLRFLREQGVSVVPEPLGTDSAGREVLAFIEGRDQGWPFIPEILSDDGAERLGALAERLRAALRRYPCPADARWQFAEGPPGPGQAVQHGDLGPWNLLWSSDGQVAGVLDWELAGPASPLYDTGYLAWFTVPLMDDDRARARGFPRPPDRTARLNAFARGTQLPAGDVVRAALRAQQEYAQRILAIAAEPWATFRRLGFHENAAVDGEWTRARFRGHLARAARQGE
jgi:Phosphotransferase enzyme family